MNAAMESIQKEILRIGELERSPETNLEKIRSIFSTDENCSAEIREVRSFLEKVLMQAHAAVMEKEAAEKISDESLRLAAFIALMNQIANVRDENDYMVIIALYELCKTMINKNKLRAGRPGGSLHKPEVSYTLSEKAMDYIHQAEAYEILQRISGEEDAV